MATWHHRIGSKGNRGDDSKPFYQTNGKTTEEEGV